MNPPRPAYDVAAALEAAMSSAEARWKVIDALEEGFYLVDRDRRIVYWNQAAERITGFPVVDVLGRRCADAILMHVDDAGRCLCKDGCPLAAAMEDGQPRRAEVYLHHKDGHRLPVRIYAAPVRDAGGQVIGSFETFSDRSADVLQAERLRDLERTAFLDPLTNIANRRLLEMSLEGRLKEWARHGWEFGVALLDVDHFKHFNDTYGHETGDRVLRMVARTLAANARPYDAVGRWGGEEFLLIAGHAGPSAAREVAERARRLIAASQLPDRGRFLSVTVSAGVAIVQPGDDSASLVRRADAALYQSKHAGRNRVTLAESASTEPALTNQE